MEECVFSPLDGVPVIGFVVGIIILRHSTLDRFVPFAEIGDLINRGVCIVELVA